MSQHYANLSLGTYIVMTIVPVILLAVWGIAMYEADRHPEWRHSAPEQRAQAPEIGPGGVRLGRAPPGPLPVPVEPTSGTEDQPDGPGRR